MKNKVIGVGFVRSKTLKGEHCKTYIYVREDGTVDINQCILSEQEKIAGFVKFRTYKGKSFFVNGIGFKFTTFHAIHAAALDILMYKGIKESDITK